MEYTRQSLLLRAQTGDPASWEHLVTIYQPLIRGWLRQQAVHPQDADDLTQEVLTILARQLPRYQHSGRTGSFRSWLRTITVNRAREYWRAGRCRADVVGGTSFQDFLTRTAT
jgi:RNA polymerase sigma-70 factor (ECF subfamily)